MYTEPACYVLCFILYIKFYAKAGFCVLFVSSDVLDVKIIARSC